MQIETKKSSGKLWAWGTATVYSLFAAGTIGFVVFASTQKVELVSEDYYKNELNYQQKIDRIHRTNTLAETVQWQLTEDGKTVNFHFPTPNVTKAIIKFYRPSSSSLDKEFSVIPDSDGNFRISVESLAKGMWRIKIEWSENDKTYYKEADVIL